MNKGFTWIVPSATAVTLREQGDTILVTNLSGNTPIYIMGGNPKDEVDLEKVMRDDYERLVRFVEEVRQTFQYQQSPEAQAAGCLNALNKLDKTGPLTASKDKDA